MASTVITDNGEKICKVVDLEDSDDDISTSSDDDSSSDDENRPPEKINIERSVDLASVKSAFTGQKNDSKIASSPSNNRVQEELEKMRLEKENNLSRLTQTFETFNADVENRENRPLIDIQRNNSVKNRVKRVFFDPKNTDADVQSSKNCCGVCQILLKSSDAKETIIHLKKAGIFHRKCFKCADCYKILTPKEYWIIGQSYYCKFHALKKEHADQEITVEMAEDMQTSNEQADDEEICDFFLSPDLDDDDEDFASVTQPKPPNPDVIKSGTKLESDFARGIGLTALQEKKKTFSSSSFDVEDFRKSIDSDQIDCQMIKQGQVKNRLSRFGQSNGSVENKESIEDEDYKNANICRSVQKKREELRLDVDAKSLKSKFENVASPNAAPKLISPPSDFDQRTAELNALKSTSGVTSTKEKFIVGVSDDGDSSAAKRQNAADEITPVAVASIQEAKEKFMKGDFGDSTAVSSSAEKFREPIPFTELTSVRERYEQNVASASNVGETRRSVSPSAAKIAAGRCAELTTLKASFESGGKKKFTDEELEQRRKKHLEAEFKRLQIEKGIFNEKQRREAEEEAKNLKACLNQDSSDPEVQKCPELNALKQRFEFMESEDSTKQAAILENWTPAEEAKLLKAKFESNAFENATSIDNEEKLKNIRAEFEHFKEMKQNDDEKNSEIEQGTAEAATSPQQDLAAAAEYAQKMRAKWDKIQKKEAKKAQKAANAKQKVTSPLAQTCQVCQKRAYAAESIERDCKLYHVTCVKCKKCGCSLRLENCFTGPDGVYCKNHFKLLFGNFSKVKANGVKWGKDPASDQAPILHSENFETPEKLVYTNVEEEDDDVNIDTQVLERDSHDGLQVEILRVK